MASYDTVTTYDHERVREDKKIEVMIRGGIRWKKIKVEKEYPLNRWIY